MKTKKLINRSEEVFFERFNEQNSCKFISF